MGLSTVGHAVPGLNPTGSNPTVKLTNGGGAGGSGGATGGTCVIREERTKRVAISAEPTTFNSQQLAQRNKVFPKTYA